ncbi:ATP-binding cassette domain-containing protein [Ureaplasma ceti]|uniref:ABC transporter ATP-binding protein n=1 Tax=Ureaplasma ceti TaxID=3119530 RepID=A0ABP9U9X7_9BACT
MSFWHKKGSFKKDQENDQAKDTNNEFSLDHDETIPNSHVETTSNATDNNDSAQPEEKVEAERVNEPTPAEKTEENKLKDRKELKKKVNTARQQKKEQKASFKSLSKEDRQALKDRAKNVEKLNKPHNGPKNLPLSGDNIIELKDVVKFYSNGYVVTQILKGINLEIKRGDFVIILGPSGSGKTTLMNIISGLDRASDGITNVCGTDLINLKDNELTKFRKDNVGYVFQQYGLLPNLTVRENVEIGANLQADKSKRLDVFEILDSVGMLMHKDKFPHQLSGGQQQRVSIARAFAKNPTILFGDEPTGAIDEEMSKMVLKEFVGINRKYQTTVIIVTHNPIFEELGTLVVKIKDGNISSLIRNEHPKEVDELPWGQE